MSGTAPSPAGGQDQSMDDILASIRRILNEDEAVAPQAADEAEPAAAEVKAPTPPPNPSAQDRAPAPPVAAPAAPPVMERPPAPAKPAPEPIELTPDMMAAPPIPAALHASKPEMPEPAPAPVINMESASDLIAPAAAAAAAASVGSLLRAVSNERSTQVHRGGPTIEDLVREELRPVLKEWLDNHLPPLVERLVRAEIERVVNRALP